MKDIFFIQFSTAMPDDPQLRHNFIATDHYRSFQDKKGYKKGKSLERVMVERCVCVCF